MALKKLFPASDFKGKKNMQSGSLHPVEEQRIDILGHKAIFKKFPVTPRFNYSRRWVQKAKSSNSASLLDASRVIHFPSYHKVVLKVGFINIVSHVCCTEIYNVKLRRSCRIRVVTRLYTQESQRRNWKPQPNKIKYKCGRRQGKLFKRK